MTTNPAIMGRRYAVSMFTNLDNEGWWGFFMALKGFRLYLQTLNDDELQQALDAYQTERRNQLLLRKVGI